MSAAAIDFICRAFSPTLITIYAQRLRSVSCSFPVTPPPGIQLHHHHPCRICSRRLMVCHIVPGCRLAAAPAQHLAWLRPLGYTSRGGGTVSLPASGWASMKRTDYSVAAPCSTMLSPAEHTCPTCGQPIHCPVSRFSTSVRPYPLWTPFRIPRPSTLSYYPIAIDNSNGIL